MERPKLRQPSKCYTQNINYTERMLDLIDTRKGELPLITFRKKVIDHHNKMNYQNEYARVRSHLNSNSILQPNTREYLLKRKALPSSLGAVDDDDRVK